MNCLQLFCSSVTSSIWKWRTRLSGVLVPPSTKIQTGAKTEPKQTDGTEYNSLASGRAMPGQAIGMEQSLEAAAKGMVVGNPFSLAGNVGMK